jgi:hypothetical protein
MEGYRHWRLRRRLALFAVAVQDALAQVGPDVRARAARVEVAPGAGPS